MGTEVDRLLEKMLLLESRAVGEGVEIETVGGGVGGVELESPVAPPGLAEGPNVVVTIVVSLVFLLL